MKHRMMVAAAAALATMAGLAQAQEMPEVACAKLHFRIAGDEFTSTCRAQERQGLEARWREEFIFAEGVTGVYIVSRAIPASAHSYMVPISPRRAAEGAGLRGIENWGEEMRVEGYRAHPFTALSPSGQFRFQCLAFAKNPAPTGGPHLQILGVYCTDPESSMDQAAAQEILERIQAN
jgi:hypothetical protein